MYAVWRRQPSVHAGASTILAGIPLASRCELSAEIWAAVDVADAVAGPARSAVRANTTTRSAAARPPVDSPDLRIPASQVCRGGAAGAQKFRAGPPPGERQR